MSTLATTTAGPTQSVFVRFLWKEYRMLRGFWIALLVLTIIEQLVSQMFFSDVRALPSWLFSSAWGGAALFAVGAAVTLFGAENEERTREFLQLLSERWLPMFLAKVLLALVGAVGLGIVLSLTGRLIGGQWPSAIEVQIALAVVGVSVLEVTAWGLLFSLKWRQPLLAAVAAMAAASFGAQLAIAATPEARDAFRAESYQAAVPMRLLLCLGLFAVNLLVARRWLQPKPTTIHPVSRLLGLPTALRSLAVPKPAGLRMFTRLLWQSWRQSWRSLLACIPIALLLVSAYLLPARVYLNDSQQIDRAVPGLVALLLPALIGALVFRADHKGDHRLFLASHAARPRLVWLTRHLVWLGALLVIMVLLQVALTMAVWSEGSRQWWRYLQHSWGYGSLLGFQFEYNSNMSQTWQFLRAATSFFRGMALGWSAFLTAYAMGQLCSFLLKSEVMAGFLAVLLSVLLSAWTLVVFHWQLSPMWFVMPIGVGAFFATWYWMPDWLLQRRMGLVGGKSALAVLVPLIVMAIALPIARLNQLPELTVINRDGTISIPHTGQTGSQVLNQMEGTDFLRLPYLAEPIKISLKKLKQDRLAGMKTAQEYENIYYEFRELAASEDNQGGRLIDNLTAEERKQLIEKITKTSLQPHCTLSWRQLTQTEMLLHLLLQEASRLTDAGELSTAFTHYCDVISMQSHLQQQSFSSVVSHYRGHKNIQENIFDGLQHWARHTDQTSAQLKSAMKQLPEYFAALPHPREALLVDYQEARSFVLEGKLSSFMDDDSIRASEYMAYLVNKLPWERERALRALDILVNLQLNYADAVTAKMDTPDVRELLRNLPKHSYPKRSHHFVHELAFGDNWKSYYESQQLTTMSLSSHLLQYLRIANSPHEYYQLLQGWVESQTRQRALLLELALLAYRLDHGEYPDRLSQLAGDYLESVPMDPFSGKSFHYRPQGLEFPLQHPDDRKVKIPSGTPLLWSVGNGNAHLVESTEYEKAIGYHMYRGGYEGRYGRGPSIEQEEPPPTPPEKETYMMFRRTESGGRGSDNLVFPLPK